MTAAEDEAGGSASSGSRVRGQAVTTESSPRLLDKLMPINCQVVMESCSGIFFCTDVLGLKKDNKVFTSGKGESRYMIVFCQWIHQRGWFAGQGGSWTSVQSQLAGNWVRDRISSASNWLLSSSPKVPLQTLQWCKCYLTDNSRREGQVFHIFPPLLRAIRMFLSFTSARCFSISLQQCRNASTQAVSSPMYSLRCSQLYDRGVSLMPSKQQSRCSWSSYWFAGIKQEKRT